MNKVFNIALICFLSVGCRGDRNIDQFVNEVIEIHNVPGISLAIVHEGEVYKTEGYGITDLDSENNVTSETLFYIASTGKAMTSLLLAHLLENSGNFKLETPIQEIVGDVFQVADGYRRSRLTVKDLLSHRTGIPTVEYHHMLGIFDTREELLERSRFFNPIQPLRAQLTYSNVWYTWAGQIAEILQNESYEDLMRRHIFGPLQMQDTKFFHEMTDEELKLMATPHYAEYIGGDLRKVEWEAYAGAELVAPSGGIVSNAVDLSKWLLLQTSEGNYLFGNTSTNKWEETRKKLIMVPYFSSEPENIEPFNEITYTEDNYGLGWFLGYYRGYRMMIHKGAFFGYWAQCTILPDVNIGIFTVINGPNGTEGDKAQTKIHHYTIDTLLDVEPWLNATTPLKNIAYNDEFLAQKDIIDKKYGSHVIRDLLSSVYTYKGKNNIEVDSSSLNSVVYNRKRKAHKTNILKQKIDGTMYAGTYGSWCCGNTTIIYNSTEDVLSGTYGQIGKFRLLPLPADNTFLMYFNEPMWFIPPVTEMIFSSSDGGLSMNKLIVPFMLPQDPPEFIRDLKYIDAPEIVDDCFYG